MRRESIYFPVFLLLFALVLFAGPEGRYAGTWASDGGANSGKVTMTISPIADGTWPTEFVFTFQDQPVKPSRVTTKIDQGHVDILCEEELDGYKLKSKFTGTLKDSVMEGKYQTTAAEDGTQVDSGTWKLTQQ
jgi:hypothetical protein